jgi:hypothetical protein
MFAVMHGRNQYGQHVDILSDYIDTICQHVGQDHLIMIFYDSLLQKTEFLQGFFDP